LIEQPPLGVKLFEQRLAAVEAFERQIGQRIEGWKAKVQFLVTSSNPTLA